MISIQSFKQRHRFDSYRIGAKGKDIVKRRARVLLLGRKAKDENRMVCGESHAKYPSEMTSNSGRWQSVMCRKI